MLQGKAVAQGKLRQHKMETVKIPLQKVEHQKIKHLMRIRMIQSMIIF